MAETVGPDCFDPPHHKLSESLQQQLDTLLQDYASQFAKDETSIRNTTLTSMMIDTGNSEPDSQKAYPIAMKHYQWVKDEIEKF